MINNIINIGLSRNSTRW